jgi:uncharacterized membrane protein
VRLVTGDRRPPLVLDDPFVTFDDRRATRALELLRTIADDLQVIVLTTSPRYDHLADRVIELPGSAAVDDAPVPRGRGWRPRLTCCGPAGGSVAFGLLSALGWGTADFGGGLMSRRAPVFGVVLVSLAAPLLVTGTLSRVLGEPIPAMPDLGWAIGAGVAAALGILCLYHGLAVGRMSVVAPVTGVLAATIPVLAGIVLEGCRSSPSRSGSAARSSPSCSSHGSPTTRRAGTLDCASGS